MSEKNRPPSEPIERVAGGRFAPGNRGGPGRPRGGMSLVQAAQRMVNPEDLVNFALKRINEPAYDEKAKVWACEWLAKIGYKLPAQTVEHTVVEPDADADVSKMSDAELDELIGD